MFELKSLPGSPSNGCSKGSDKRCIDEYNSDIACCAYYYFSGNKEYYFNIFETYMCVGNKSTLLGLPKNNMITEDEYIVIAYCAYA
jgi:hypothetical protein